MPPEGRRHGPERPASPASESPISAATDPGWRLVCRDCGASLDFAPHFHGCPNCPRGLLELRRTITPPISAAAHASGRGLRRYLDFLPVANRDSWISLGEGGTALVRSRTIGRRLGLENLFFKLEQQNPTGSFKDRFVAVTLNLARHFGYERIVVSSTGNLGVSVAAYAAACGLRCLFIAPDGTPAGILREAELHGSEVRIVAREDRFAAFDNAAEEPGCFPVGLFIRRRVQNPFGIESYRSFAYEMIEELGDVPGVVLFPCARGNGLYGAWKGFLDARDWGWAARLPRLVGCQPAVANSLEMSLRTGAAQALELAPAESIARSICETVASDEALQAIRQSGGTATSASEDEIRDAVALLGREGINAEASAAATVACLPALLASRHIRAEDTVVCVLTAGGLRWTG